MRKKEKRAKMAYATVMSLFRTTEWILQVDRLKILDWDDQIRYIHGKASFFISFLEEHSTGNDEQVKSVEILIRDVGHLGEDVIGNHISGLLRLGSNLEAVMMIRCRSKHLTPPKNFLPVGSSRATPSGNNTLVGLDEDLIKLKERLAGHPANLQIIPIVGMDGIGKTTLAKTIYDDALIVHHFHIRAWVTISQVYDPSHVVRNLLDQLQSKTFAKA